MARGAGCLEDALVRDLGVFGGRADRARASFELAKDDLVFANQQGAEVANPVGEAGGDPLLERPYVLLAHVRPEALCNEASGIRVHRDRN